MLTDAPDDRTAAHKERLAADPRFAAWVALDVPGPNGTGIADMRQLWLCGHRAVHGVRRKVPGLQAVLLRCQACQDARGKP